VDLVCAGFTKWRKKPPNPTPFEAQLFAFLSAAIFSLLFQATRVFVLKIYENLFFPKAGAKGSRRNIKRHDKTTRNCSREESGKSGWGKAERESEEQSSGQFAFSICSNKQEGEISAGPQTPSKRDLTKQ